MNNEADEHIKENLASIRAYLYDQFQGFDIYEQKDYPLSYTFTVTKLKPLTQYKLKVSWLMISDDGFTPVKIKRLLINEGVAAKMKASHGENFPWGW